MSETSNSRSDNRWLWISLAAILIVAALFRLWQIGETPPGLFGDEAADGLDALDVLAGRGQVFFPSNFGREGLHMWILALSLKLGGVTPLAVRIPSALAGIITALATLWLGYELFIPVQRQKVDIWEGRQAQLVKRLIVIAAALYLSTSYWHVHFSRFGIRGVFTTTMTALTMAALWRGLNQHRLRWFALAGLFMGLGAYFYTASRFVPVLVALFAGWWLLASLLGVRLRERIDSVMHFLVAHVLLFAVAAVVFAPLGYYFLTHPGSFTQRASEVSAFQQGSLLAALPTIARAAGANLLQFVGPGAGDQARFYNLPGRAVFDPLTALLALLGLFVCLKYWRNPVYAFLVLWLLVMASPSFLAVDRYPTLPRLLGVIPGVYFFPAVGLARLFSLIARPLERRPAVARTLILLLFISSLATHAVLTYRDYFRVWGPAPATADAFETDMTDAWRWLRAHPNAGEVYLSSDLYKHPTFMFLHEQTPTSEYFTRRNPNLHWFDARRAWPLLRPERATTILVGSSAPPPPYIRSLLGIALAPVEGGAAMLATSAIRVEGPVQVVFTEQLGLVAQGVFQPADMPDNIGVFQVWRTRGPVVSERRPYQIQSALLDAAGRQLVQASADMGYLPPEWDDDGFFMTWQLLPWQDLTNIQGTALRLAPHGQPPLQPAQADAAGWLTFPLLSWDAWQESGG